MKKVNLFYHSFHKVKPILYRFITHRVKYVKQKKKRFKCFTLHAMNLKYMKVSLFWNKLQEKNFHHIPFFFLMYLYVSAMYGMSVCGHVLPIYLGSYVWFGHFRVDLSTLTQRSSDFLTNNPPKIMFLLWVWQTLSWNMGYIHLCHLF